MSKETGIKLDNREDWLRAYTDLNNSFDKCFVFRLGADAGFFSEFNNMVLAMLYCLSNRFKFVLYSKSERYSHSDAWNDFFVQFCPQNTDSINQTINLRPYQIVNSRRFALKVRSFKLFRGVDYLTQDLWDLYHDTHKDVFFDEYNIPELGIFKASILEATKIIIKNIWVYNNKTEKEIQLIRNEVRLPVNYISIHIRKGDKVIEKETYSVAQYMRLALKVDSQCKDFFISTDDYSVVEELKDKYKKTNLYSLSLKQNSGYYHEDFMRLDPESKYTEHLRLFASMDLCANGEKYIGTYSSNLGMFMGMKMGENKCLCVDFDRWLIW